MTDVDKASTATKATNVEVATTQYREGGLEPLRFVTDDGLHTRLWYYEKQNHPFTLPATLSTLTLSDGTSLDEASKLTCQSVPTTGTDLLPLCAQYQYLLLPNGTKQSPVLTLFGYAEGSRDGLGNLIPNTVLTLDGLEAFDDSDSQTLEGLTLNIASGREGLIVALVQASYDYDTSAIKSNTRVCTNWYKDDSARSTQTLTEVLSVGAHPGTHELLRTAPLTVNGNTYTATVLRQILSARSGRVLRETQQDANGTPIAFTCHSYNSRGQGVSSTTYPFEETAFINGEVSEETPGVTQSIVYSVTSKGSMILDCDQSGRHQRCYYDSLQRNLRRELQRHPGYDHGPDNYCIIEENTWGADGQIANQVSYDYLPGGLRIDNVTVMPQRSEDWCWQTHSKDLPLTHHNKDVSATTCSTIGLFSTGALATRESTHTNRHNGDVTVTHETWKGAEKSAAGTAIKTTETFNDKGLRVGWTEHLPDSGKADRTWNITYDDLRRQTSVTRPDKSIVSWAYTGLSNIPVSVSVKPAGDAKPILLGSRTLEHAGNQRDRVATVTRGSEPTISTRSDGWNRPDGSAVYRKQDEDGRMSWYTQAGGDEQRLASFKYNVITQAMSTERAEQTGVQSLITSEAMTPLLLGAWYFQQSVHGQQHHHQATTSYRGEVDGAWLSNGLSMQAWSNGHGQRSRLRRGDLEYSYDYTPLGLIACITVQDMSGGQHLRVDYAYDAFGREVDRHYWLDGVATLSYSQTWSDANQVVSKSLFRNGATAASRVETFTYNTTVTGKSDQLQKWSVDAKEGDEVKDGSGRAIQEQTYSYDVLGSMTGCTTLHTNGERCVRTYEYKDAAHPTRRTKDIRQVSTKDGALGKAISVELTYDANGNLLSNEQQQSLAYTETGRLRSVTAKGQTLPLTYYEYDGHDRLIAQWDAASKQRRVLDYSINGLCSETWLNAEGGVVKRQVLDDEVGLAVALDGQWCFVLSDPQNGGGDEYQRNADGTWQRKSLSFTPWGETHTDSLRAMRVGLGYNGQRVDPVTGGYHLGEGYRLYDPAHKAFYQPDDWSPLGAGGLNDRAYCASGDPVNWHDPSGHIMINRNDSAASLTRLDNFISEMKFANQQPTPEAASWKEWVLFGFVVTVSAIAIVASFGTAWPAVAALLMVGLAAGASITAAGMALRQKDPELSQTLEPVGQMIMAVASAPAFGAQMPTAARWIMYISTAAYVGLEISSLAVQRSNPDLAEKLGWGATAAGLADLAISGVVALGRTLASKVGTALGAIRQLRNAVKLRGAAASFNFRTRHLAEAGGFASAAQTKRWHDIELGGRKTAGRVVSEQPDTLPGFHLFEDLEKVTGTIAENHKHMMPFIKEEQNLIGLATKKGVKTEAMTTYQVSLNRAKASLEKLTKDSQSLKKSKKQFYKKTEKSYRSVRSASEELNDMLAGKLKDRVGLSDLNEKTVDQFYSNLLQFTNKYSSSDFSQTEPIITAVLAAAGKQPPGQAAVSHFHNLAQDLKRSLGKKLVKLEAQHDKELHSIGLLDNGISQQLSKYETMVLPDLRKSQRAYTKTLMTSANRKQFKPADIPAYIAPKRRLNIIGHSYAFDEKSIPQMGRYVARRDDGTFKPVSTSAEQLFLKLTDDFKNRMEAAPDKLKNLTNKSFSSITDDEWKFLAFKKQYSSIRMISCNLAIEIKGVSYARQFSKLTKVPVKASIQRVFASIPDSVSLFKKYQKSRSGLSFSDYFDNSLLGPRVNFHIPKQFMPGYYGAEFGIRYKMETILT